MQNISVGGDVGVAPVTIEVLARGFYRESVTYGFQLPDYIQFVNVLLGAAIASDSSPSAPQAHSAARVSSVDSPQPRDGSAAQLPLVGADILVRAMRRGDRPHLERWLADPQGRHFLLSPMSGEVLNLSALLNQSQNVIGMITLPDGTPIGCLAFLNVNHHQGRAELRKLIGEREMRGRGLAKQATALWIRYAAEGLALRKICLYTLGSNIRNIQLNEDLGFEVEGILRNEVVVDGRPHDVVRMGLTLR